MAVNFLSTFILVLLPIIAGLLIISPFFPNNAIKIRRFAKAFCAFNLFYSILFMLFIPCDVSGFAFVEQFPLNIMPNLNVSIVFGLDNVSALLCVLSSFVMLLALIASKSLINSRQKSFYSLMLFLLGAVFGIFAANTLFTFLTFWMLLLPPAYFLISIPGGNNTRKNAVKFVLFSFASSILIMISTALVYAYCADLNILSDFGTLIKKSEDFPVVMQMMICAGFSIAFALRLPVFPLHSWLVEVHSEVPAPVSAVLAGILLNTAAYGFIRINLQMYYDVFQLFAPVLILFAAIGVVWASCAAIAQNNIKKLVSCISLVNMGIILIGIASFTEFGLTGAIFHMVAHSLIISGLFIGVGIINAKFKTDKLELLSGIAKYVLGFAGVMLIIGLSAAFLPLTAGFSGAFMSLAGGFNSPLIEKAFFASDLMQFASIFATVGTALSGVYVLRFLHKTFFGLSEFDFGEIKLANHQFAVLAIFSAGILIFGIYPMGIIDKISAFAQTNISNILTAIF